MKKFWSSYKKELILASRGFYFYVEILMAALILLVMFFVVPDKFAGKESQYVYMDMPQAASDALVQRIAQNDLDGKPEEVEVKIGKEKHMLLMYESSSSKTFILESDEMAEAVADKERKTSATVYVEDGALKYRYYLQGYESPRLKNLLMAIHSSDMTKLESSMNSQTVQALGTNYSTLSDKQNVLPVILTFNGSLMGLFIIASYIFLDKLEGVIKAFAITSSSVRTYLLSKAAIVTTSALAVSLVITIPLMGLGPNYFGLILLLITTGFFISALGLLIGSYYENITQAFGIIFILIIFFVIPNISYFIPSFSPGWIRFLPTYWFIQGFKECLLEKGDLSFVLWLSLAFAGLGTLLFALSEYRYKKTLTI